MLNKLNFIIKLLFIVVLFQSCDDDWMFDIPGCMDQNAINYDSNATINNDSCYFSGEIITINAQDYDEWIYFSVNQGNEVEPLMSNFYFIHDEDSEESFYPYTKCDFESTDIWFKIMRERLDKLEEAHNESKVEYNKRKWK